MVPVKSKDTNSDQKEQTTKPENTLKHCSNEVSDDNYRTPQKDLSDTTDTIQITFLQMVHDLSTDTASKIISTDPVARIVKQTWKHYKNFFYAWWFFHFVFMILLTVVAVYRSQQLDNVNIDSPPTFKYKLFQNIPVTIYAFVCFLVSVVYIVFEIMAFSKPGWRENLETRKIKSAILHPYGNAWFRLSFVVMSLCLITDLIVAPASSLYENYLLIFAVVISWFLQLFFLRTFRPFSFFTFIISKVFINDMFPFFVVLALQVFAFSTAMYMSIQGSELAEAEDYVHFGRVSFTMAKVMVGIGDIESLYETRQPWLSISIFIAFVIVTVLLLFNALITSMGQTCTIISDLMSRPNFNHWMLQRLAFIVYLENFLPNRFISSLDSPFEIRSERDPESTDHDQGADSSKKEVLQEKKRKKRKPDVSSSTYVTQLKPHTSNHCQLDVKWFPNVPKVPCKTCGLPVYDGSPYVS